MNALNANEIARREALAELRRRGIGGNEVYLLDVLPLIEMAWADGEVQPAERTMILSFLDDHLARLDAAAGATVVTRAQALAFVDRFLAQRPTPRQFAELRGLLRVLRLGARDARQRAQRILDGAMAVGAVAPSPTVPAAAWDTHELALMWELEDTLVRG